MATCPKCKTQWQTLPGEEQDHPCPNSRCGYDAEEEAMATVIAEGDPDANDGILLGHRRAASVETVPPRVTDDQLRELAERLKRPVDIPVECIPPGVADALQRAVRAGIDMLPAPCRPGDVTVVPRAELDLLRACATAAVAVARRYDKRVPWRPDIAAVVEAGQQIIARGTDLGTLSASETQLERNRAECIEWVINFTHARKKYEKAMDGERLRTILPDPITSPGTHDRLVDALETLSAYGPRLEGKS